MICTIYSFGNSTKTLGHCSVTNSFLQIQRNVWKEFIKGPSEGQIQTIHMLPTFRALLFLLQ